MLRNCVIHEIFSEFLKPLRDVGTQRVSPFYRGFVFIWFGILDWTGLPVLSSMYLTQALDGNLPHSDFPFLESPCRLTQLWLVK